MSHPSDTHLLLRAFADELARCGVTDVCTSPGSRSTPLVLALGQERRLRSHSHIDERCSGFFALGLAKATGRPVVVTCTSGTAAAELLPAVIEAREARVPLIVLTADRPAELREIGAGQSIDQIKIFGSAAKWFFEVGTHEADPGRLRWVRTLACRACWTALEGRPGVAHLNFPLREPLSFDGALAADESGRPGGVPFVERSASLAPGGGDAGLERLAELAAGAARAVLVAGRHERSTPLAAAAAELCGLRGWPLLADPLSGARRGEAAIANYDALLRDQVFAETMRPDLVIRVGDLPTSKPLREWLAELEGVTQVLLDPDGAWQDPDAVLGLSLALEPAAALASLGRGPGRVAADGAGGRDETPAADAVWLEAWRAADERAAGAIEARLAGEGLSEPMVAAELGRLLDRRSTLFVASSMPVRDIESFWPVLAKPPRVLCNRGANGIDGTVSSAFGACAARDPDGGGGSQVVLLIGDVALAHDIGGLIAARRLGLKLTIVLIQNEGGGIFDFLPVARSESAHRHGVYERHILTPTGLDFSLAAALYGLDHELAGDLPGFRAALERALAAERSSIVEVRTERGANVALHGLVWQDVRDALGADRIAG